MESRARREARDGRLAQHNISSPTLLTHLGFRPQITKRNVTAFLVHCSASILFLVFINASQPFLIHQLDADSKKHVSGRSSRVGSLSGSLIFYDELISAFVSLLWGALAEIVGLAAVTSTSYLFIAAGLVSYTLPRKAWPDLILARLIFAIGGSGATAMLSGILSDFSGSHCDNVLVADNHAFSRPAADHDSETTSQGTVRPHSSQNEQTEGVGAEESAALIAEGEGLALPAKQQRRHGRVAAIAGVFTGIGALIAVFVLVRLPQKIADYLEDHEPSGSATLAKDDNKGAVTDLTLRRATVATFMLVAALALLVAAITALGLRRKAPAQTRYATDGIRRSQRAQEDYGALHDSTIALADDTRQARRARLRQRMERRSHASWTNVIRAHISHFRSASIGGFRMAGSVGRDASSDNGESARKRSRLASELRMAYLGGALARAFTIGTTAFLPLLVTHHYYTSGLCRQLPSPNPNAPLPNDELKKLCRRAFTATAILGGTAQLTALLAAPIIGLLCDAFSPTTTISVTSALGGVGFYLLGVGTSGFAGDAQTGEEVPDPLKAVSIAAAVLVGFGQIGAIVASLAGCARARGILAEHEAPDYDPSHNGDDSDAVSGQETLVPGRRSIPHRKDVRAEAGQGPGAIAGAYTCTGSLSILIISKLGGLLFDMYVPSPFLLIGGFSLFVSLCGFGITITKRFKRS